MSYGRRVRRVLGLRNVVGKEPSRARVSPQFEGCTGRG
jgi:hypothetical protein